MFLKMNKGLAFNDDFLRKNQMDGYLKVPMSVESFELPRSLVDLLKQMLAQFGGIGNEANRSNTDAFLTELKKNQEVLMQFPDKANQVAKMMEQLVTARDAKHR